MVILGLTGSIAMGKSAAASAFARLGIPVFDSDREVHALLGKKGAVTTAIAENFPGVVEQGVVDRQRLAGQVFGDDKALRLLEGIIHPEVRARQVAFLKRVRGARKPLAVMDIPLLFETGGDAWCDYVAVVSAPLFLQRQRVLRRPGMTARRFDAILEQQMPDREKRRRADFVIPTGLGKGEMVKRVERIAAILKRRRGWLWQTRAAFLMRGA